MIGNPPYVRQETLGEQKTYFAKKYTVYHGMADLYTYFFERGLQLLKQSGLFGIIVANKWMRANYGEPLRKWLKTQSILEISDFSDLPVFQGATTYPCIVIAAPTQTFSKPHVIAATNIDTLDFQSLAAYIQQHQKAVAIESLDDAGWNLGSEAEHGLLKKLQNAGMPLGKYVNGKIFIGIKTGFNEAFLIDKKTKERLISEDLKSSEIIKPYIVGRDIKRYCSLSNDRYIIFLRRGIDLEVFPAIKKHLSSYKERLTPKPKDFAGSEWKGRKAGAYKWYELQDPIEYHKEFDKAKIVYAEISTTGNFTLDEKGMYIDMTSFAIGSDDRYLLAILNSILCKFYFSKYSSEIRGGFLRWKRQYVEHIPIKTIHANSKEEKQRHDEIVKLVDTMLALNKEKQQTTLPEKLESLQHRIQYTDAKINQLVYQLYGLTEEEIALVEKS